MTKSQKHIRCAQVGGVAVVTTALAIGLATAPQEHSSRISIESHLVRLQAATLSAVANSTAPAPAASTYPSLPDAPSNPSANATVADLSPQNAIALVVGLAIGAVAAVFWYPTFPVTLPLTYFGFSFVTRILGGQALDLGTTLQTFLVLPFALGASVVGNPPIFANSAAAVAHPVRAAASAASVSKMRSNVSRQSSTGPAPAQSKRSARSAKTPKAASAASKRQSAG